jgi:hypothetical protein
MQFSGDVRVDKNIAGSLILKKHTNTTELTNKRNGQIKLNNNLSSFPGYEYLYIF